MGTSHTRSGVSAGGFRRSVVLVVSLLWSGAGGVLVAPMSASGAEPHCFGLPATIVGTTGDDSLTGTDGDDVIVGGEGLDSIHGGPGDDRICGGPTVVPLDGDPAIQFLDGGTGDDLVEGGSGSDGLVGDAGVDLLLGNGGRDTLHGGPDGIPSGEIDTLRGGSGNDHITSESGDRVFGDRGSDTFEASTGAAVYDGGAGADRFASGPGNDIFRGGAGRDVVSYVMTVVDSSITSSHCNDINADLARGFARGVGFGRDTLRGIENLWTSGGSDVLKGNNVPNVFYPGLPCPKKATIDSVTGRRGADGVTFDSGRTEGSGAVGSVYVDLTQRSARWRLPPHASSRPARLRLVSIQHVTGTDQPDVILGDSASNSLHGGSSPRGDLLRGRRGHDRMFGGDGNDRIYAGKGRDLLLGQNGADWLSGQSGSDHLHGGPGPDQLLGRQGVDRLSGQQGNDRAYGGRGADLLRGGSANDRLDGGPGLNRNDGGDGIDVCRRPARGVRVINCER